MDVAVGRDAAQRVAAVTCGDLQRRVEVVDPERDAVHDERDDDLAVLAVYLTGERQAGEHLIGERRAG